MILLISDSSTPENRTFVRVSLSKLQLRNVALSTVWKPFSIFLSFFSRHPHNL